MRKFFALLIALGLALSPLAKSDDEWTSESCAEGDQDVRILSRQQPFYPHSAMMFCVTGKVRAAFVIDARGIPKDIRLVESDPETIFDQAAVAAIEQWRFSPACRNGVPAERDAVQTIEFRLQAEALEGCADDRSKLDDQALELIGEIGARYALLAQYWRLQHSPEDIRSAINAPFPPFEGDPGAVAAFHRQMLSSMTRSRPGHNLTRLGNNVVMALRPNALKDDAQLENVRRHLALFRAALDDWLDHSQARHAEQASAYQRLKRETGYDESTLDLLVTSFTGDLEMPFDEAVAPQLQSPELVQAMVDFLDARRPTWHIADEVIYFSNQEDQVAWQAMWDDLAEHEKALQSLHLAMLRSFEDYSKQ